MTGKESLEGESMGSPIKRLAMLQYVRSNSGMARKPRVHYRAALYHVILRGNDGQSIFFDDKDRTRFFFLYGGRAAGAGQRSPNIGSPRDDGMARSGVRGEHTWRIGEVTGRDVTTRSSAAKRLRMRAKEDSELAGRMNDLLRAAI
jgi:hypothetical protein